MFVLKIRIYITYLYAFLLISNTNLSSIPYSNTKIYDILVLYYIFLGILIFL